MWAGGLIAVAIVGPAIWDGFWLALVLAAILSIVAVSDLHAEWRPGDGRIGAVGARLLALAATALVVLSLLDAAIVASRGVEPGWMETADRLAGYASWPERCSSASERSGRAGCRDGRPSRSR